jgi:hypothetical protein
MELPEFQLAPYLVTCHTKKCENAEITIPIDLIADNPLVFCGVCSKKITDTVPLTITE